MTSTEYTTTKTVKTTKHGVATLTMISVDGLVNSINLFCGNQPALVIFDINSLQDISTVCTEMYNKING
jgi:hypothetical protein